MGLSAGCAAGVSVIGPYFACLPRGPPEADAPAAPQPLVALLLRVWHTCESAWASRGADLLTIAPMVYLHFRFLRVVTAVMGWWPLWFGPACGYVVPICLLIVRAGLAAFPVKP